jgi:glutaredoxin-related protein
MIYEKRKRNKQHMHGCYVCPYATKEDSNIEPCDFTFQIYQTGSMKKTHSFIKWRDKYRNEKEESEFDSKEIEL